MSGEPKHINGEDLIYAGKLEEEQSWKDLSVPDGLGCKHMHCGVTSLVHLH